MEATLSSREPEPGRNPFAAYVPPFVRRRVQSRGLPAGPEQTTARGAVLLADISGFTALTETLAAAGAAGAERLRDLINGCFSQLIDTISAHGGEVVHFAGDAALAVWFAESASVGATAAAAAECAEAIRLGLDGREFGGHRIRLRSGVGCGVIEISYVGGVRGRWECLLSGPAVEQSVGAVARAERGAASLSAEVVAAVEAIEAHAVDGDDSGTQPPPADAATDTEGGIGSGDLPDAVRAFVPRGVQSRIDAGQAGWLAEFRQISTLFANLDLASVGDLESLQATIAGMQGAVFDYGGSILQLLVEDKGLTLLAVWGTSMSFHEDNATRAVRAGLEVQALLAGAGHDCRLGITTGTAFIGTRGNETRQEFAVVGDIVNLAARLMQASRGAPLCDAATRSGARHDFVFEALPPLSVKGKLDKIPVYRPTARAPRRAERDGPAVVGRERETELLSQALGGLEAAGKGGLVLLEGQPGIGKSNLLAWLLRQTQSSTVRSLVARGEPLEQSTIYQAWESIFERLLGLAPNASVAQRDAAAIACLEANDVPTDLAALLNPIIDSDVAESPTLEQMSSLGRAERTRELLLRILGSAIRDKPTLLICEDAHWFDSASLELVNAVVTNLPGVLCIIAARESEAEAAVPRLQQLPALDQALRIRLQPLSKAGTLELISSLWNADLVPQPVVEWIHEQAGGHPLFTEQLASALRDEGLIRVRGGEIQLQGGPETLRRLRPPETVQNIVMSRIDRLPPDEQLLLKVASVAGNTVETALLVAVYPVEATAAALEESLTRLCALGWLVAETSGATSSYQFGHAVARDIAYDSLSFAQRRELHEQVALWLEAQDTGSAASLDPVLAHHWTVAGNSEKAFGCLERAGLKALRDHANVEAAYFFTRAIELASSPESRQAEPDTLRRARWHRLLGEACIRMWEIKRAIENLEQALGKLDQPVPSTNAGRVQLVAAQALRQAALRVKPSRRAAAEGTLDRELEAAAAAAQMSFVATHRRDAFNVIAFSLLAANLSERAGMPHPRALGVLGLAADAMGLRKLALRYFERAYERARQPDQIQDLPPFLVLYGSFLIGRAELDAAERLLEEGLEVATEIGDRESLGDLLIVYANPAARRGDFTTFGERINAAIDALRGLTSENSQPYLKIGLLHSHAQTFAPEEAYLYLERVREAMRSDMEHDDKLLLLLLASWNALILARAGRVEAACAAADEAMSYLRENLRMVPGVCWMIAENTAEAYLDCCERLHERQAGGPAATALLHKARSASAKLDRWSKLYPVSRACALLMRGRVEWLAGRPARAASLWQRSLDLAGRLQLPFDEARAHLELGRHGFGDADSHLEAAQQAFTAFRAPAYIEQSRRALAGRAGMR